MLGKDFLILLGKMNTKMFITKPDVLGHFNSNLKNAEQASRSFPVTAPGKNRAGADRTG